jgi:hypothetical protein
MLAAFLPGAMGGVAEADTPAKKKPKKEAEQPLMDAATAAASVPELHMTDAHVGVSYSFRIRGVTGVDVTDFQCKVDGALPPGLEFDCKKLLISGKPTGKTGMTYGEIEISDSSDNLVRFNYAIEVVDRPDEGWVGAAPALKRRDAASLTVAPVKAVKSDDAPKAATAATSRLTAKTADVARGSQASAPAEVAATDEVRVKRPNVAAVGEGTVLRNAVLTSAAGQPLTVAPVAQAAAAPVTNPAAPAAEVAPVIPPAPASACSTGLAPSDATASYAIFAPPAAKFKVGQSPLSLEIPVPTSGNMPTVKVEALSPGATDGKWGTLKSTTAQDANDKGSLTVTLIDPLVAGQKVAVVVTGAAGAKDFTASDGSTTATAVMCGEKVYTALAVEKATLPSNLKEGATTISGTATPSISGATVNVVLVDDSGYAASSKKQVQILTQDLAAMEITQQVPTEAAKKKLVGELTKVQAKAAQLSGAAMSDVVTKTGAAIALVQGLKAAPVAAEVATLRAASDAAQALKTAKDGDSNVVEACMQAADATGIVGREVALSGSTSAQVATGSTGNFTFTLASPLVEGQSLQVVQILPANNEITDEQKKICTGTATAQEVAGVLDWGRVHADFIGGLLISNDSAGGASSDTTVTGNFSQAHQFYALNAEKVWSLPGCYLRVSAKDAGTDVDQCYDWTRQRYDDAHRWQHLWPGVSTYFQVRLTAIPVSTVSMSPAAGAATGTGTSGSAGSSGTAAAKVVHANDDSSATATASTTPSSNFITSGQTAKVEIGAYMPFLISRWEHANKPNALFLAPLAKVGIDTVTGPSSVTLLTAGGTGTTSQNFEPIYNNWSFGGRVGHMELGKSENKAPETYSYLDITFGPYSNLQSFICHGSDHATTLPSTSTCLQPPSNPFVVANGVDSRKRLYRLDIEGLLKIPETPFYVGLNANLGQKTLGATGLDRGFAAPDDLRFFFGTKFDIASVLMKFQKTP